jgi:hypothetical protein
MPSLSIVIVITPPLPLLWHHRVRQHRHTPRNLSTAREAYVQSGAIAVQLDTGIRSVSA